MSGRLKLGEEHLDDLPATKDAIDRAKELSQVDAEASARIEASPRPKLQAAIEVLNGLAVKGADVELAIELLQDHAKPRDGKHEFAFVSEDENEATFRCTHCGSTVAFVLPGRGEPHVDGPKGARAVPADFMKYVDRCAED